MLLEEKERKKEGGKRAKAIGTVGSKVQEETGEGAQTVRERGESKSETRGRFITERYASGETQVVR